MSHLSLVRGSAVDCQDCKTRVREDAAAKVKLTVSVDGRHLQATRTLCLVCWEIFATGLETVESTVPIEVQSQ